MVEVFRGYITFLPPKVHAIILAVSWYLQGKVWLVLEDSTLDHPWIFSKLKCQTGCSINATGTASIVHLGGWNPFELVGFRPLHHSLHCRIWDVQIICNCLRECVSARFLLRTNELVNNFLIFICCWRSRSARSRSPIYRAKLVDPVGQPLHWWFVPISATFWWLKVLKKYGKR